MSRSIKTALFIGAAIAAHVSFSMSEELLHLSYNEEAASTVIENKVNGSDFSIHTINNPAERVPGIEGSAFRTDGYSTWAFGNISLPAESEMTIETWVALESYPSTAETSLRDSALLHSFKDGKGFEVGIDTYGNWWFTVNINGELRTVEAPERFPLYEWSHVAAVVDEGKVQLYLNGEQISESTGASGAILWGDNQPLELGRAPYPQYTDVFHVNGINAAYDETRLFTTAQPASHFSQTYNEASKPSWQDSLLVSKSRFADDELRPRFHAMPPANWTNEPHGLVHKDGRYHMFYQRTPNGPYKWMMHWGHMESDDLVHWTHKKDALYPELNHNGKQGMGSKGIWSGDVVIENGVAHAFYTTVNFGGPYDPGIGWATSEDDDLSSWEKIGGIIDKNSPNPGGIADFRDPYLWKEGNTWHMVIGAALGSGGSVEYYTSKNLSSGIWNRSSQPFSSVPFSAMDTGSAIWEMPVFEYLGDHNGERKYILVVSPIGGNTSKNNAPFVRSVYWIGTWQTTANGEGQFTPDFNMPKNLDVIHGHLSPTVARGQDGVIRAIGIVDERSNSELQNRLGWAHTYSLPRAWRLLEDGQTLGQTPVASLTSLRVPGSEQNIGPQSVTGSYKLPLESKAAEIIVDVGSGTTGHYGLSVFESPGGENRTLIYYDGNDIVIDKTRSSSLPGLEEMQVYKGEYDESIFGKPERFHVYLDHSVITVFINNKAVFSNRVYPDRSDSNGIYLYSQQGTAEFSAVKMYELADADQPQSGRATIIQSEDIIEGQESGAQFIVELSNIKFQTDLSISEWSLSNAPENVEVAAIERVSDTTVIVTLGGNTTADYDSNINNARLDILASQLQEPIEGNAVSVTGLTFVAIVEPVTTLVQQAESEFTEGDIDGATFNIRLSNNEFSAPLDESLWQAMNFPEGVSYKLELIDSSTVKVTLCGDATDLSTDITNVGFIVDPAAFVYADPELHGASVEVSSGLVFKAVNKHLVFDFESGSFQNWCAYEGDAFGDAGVTNATVWHGGTFNQSGDYHYWGFANNGDEATGAARTGAFTLGGDGIVKFLVAGGNDLERLYLALVHESTGEVLLKATGHDSETYRQVQWDVSLLRGERVYLQLVDQSSNGWGHINIDNISVPVADDSDGTLPSAQIYPVTSINLTSVPETMNVGGVETLEYQVQPQQTCGAAITWSSSNPAVATVSEDGQVHATAEGVVTIRAYVAGTDIADEVSISVEPAAPVIELGFESGDLSGWTVQGGAFSNAAVSSATCYWAECFSFSREGAYHFWGFANGGDEAVGQMLSQPFVLGGDGQISFLIGGGNDLQNIYIALVRDSSGEELLKATGKDSEQLTPELFDAYAYVGETLRLKVVDRATGGWGHINLDSIKVPGQVVNDDSNPVPEPTDGQLVYDFENANLTGWTLEGNAFTQGNLSTQDTYWDGRAFNQQGNYHLWGFGAAGDSATGTMTSEPFILGGEGIVRVLVGGGDDFNQLYFSLIRADTGEVVAKVSGNNDEAYRQVELDLSGYVGQQLQVKIVDYAVGGFGHINVDNIVIPIALN